MGRDDAGPPDSGAKGVYQYLWCVSAQVGPNTIQWDKKSPIRMLHHSPKTWNKSHGNPALRREAIYIPITPLPGSEGCCASSRPEGGHQDSRSQSHRPDRTSTSDPRRSANNAHSHMKQADASFVSAHGYLKIGPMRLLFVFPHELLIGFAPANTRLCDSDPGLPRSCPIVDPQFCEL